MPEITIQPGDALVLVDVPIDLLPGDALPVQEGDRIVAPLNHRMERMADAGLPTFTTRDWHPPHHCSFRTHSRPCPPHCIAGNTGSPFPIPIHWSSLPPTVINKGTHRNTDANSRFKGTELNARLHGAGIRRLFIAGLAIDYCVLNTAIDARGLGHEVVVLEHAIRPIELQPGDGDRAITKIRAAGATTLQD